MKRLALITIFSTLMMAAPVLAQTQRASIEVSELSCPSCYYIAAQAMVSVAGVEIEAFLEGEEFGFATYTITYDDATTSAEQVVDAVLGYGYPARIVEAPGS